MHLKVNTILLPRALYWLTSLCFSGDDMDHNKIKSYPVQTLILGNHTKWY